MRGATQRRAIPEMPLQIRAARPVRASVQKNRSSFPPVYPFHASFPSPSISFFSSASSAFVWSSSTRVPVPPRFRFPPLRSYNPIVGVESRLAGKGTMGEKEERQEGNAVTRENPLRNVFGACTTRCYLQCRACKIYV